MEGIGTLHLSSFNQNLIAVHRRTMCDMHYVCKYTSNRFLETNVSLALEMTIAINVRAGYASFGYSSALFSRATRLVAGLVTNLKRDSIRIGVLGEWRIVQRVKYSIALFSTYPTRRGSQIA